MELRKILEENPLCLAPMAGVTDKTYRKIVKDYNCGLLFTEMVSTKGLIFGSERTGEMIDIDSLQHPIAVQIFGNNPDEFAKVVEYVQKKGADIIDINMGCPAQKIVKNNEGAALLRDINRAESIIKKVVENASVPVTVKIRKGWCANSIVAMEYAQMAQYNKIAGISIHGRTREQFYSGKADWDIIKEIKKRVDIVVIGNGDVFEPQDAKKLLDYTGCDGVMIGRGAMGNPWLFNRSYKLIKENTLLSEPTVSEKIHMAIYHLKEHIKYKGEYMGIRQMRKHISWYLKGLPDATYIRDLVNTIEDQKDIIETLLEYEKKLKEN